jgi:hypothetical protein
VRSARTYAVLTWVYAACFGIPAIPISVYVLRRGTLPWFFDFFPMYGGPWWNRFGAETFVGLLFAFLVVALAVSWAAWRVWRGSRAGALLGLCLMPVEAVFWYGFALPVPVVLAAARLGFLAAGWRALR